MLYLYIYLTCSCLITLATSVMVINHLGSLSYAASQIKLLSDSERFQSVPDGIVVKTAIIMGALFSPLVVVVLLLLAFIGSFKK